MTVSLKHQFTSAKSDGGDSSLVQPSNWNAEHTLTLSNNRVLGRNAGTDGAVQELSGSDLRTLTGLATTDSPQFTALNVGHATDTTIARVSAGVISVEGSNVILASNKLSALSATTSAELAGVISDETGSGALVFGTSPTLTTPTLGVASATSVNKVAITAPATGATLTIAEGKTLTASNSLTLAGTDGTTMTFPSSSGTVLTTATANNQSTTGPTVTKYTSGSGTYTVPSGVKWLRVFMVGGGGGGGGSGTTPTTGTSGGNTTFGSRTASGGDSNNPSSIGVQYGGYGGGTSGASSGDIIVTGGNGMPSASGGMGGMAGFFGGGNSPGNTGSGPGGGGGGQSGTGGGGAGGFIHAIIVSPSASYSYAIGAGGNGGAAGTGGYAGGAGAAGAIFIEEHYNN